MVGSITLLQSFKTAEEVEAAIVAYSKEQMVPYVIHSSKSIAFYNKNQQKKGSSARLSESLKWKEATIACKHHGRPREHKHKAGTKQRPNQSSFKKFCPAKFSINYNVLNEHFVVTQLHECHENHVMDDDLAVYYPEFRAPSAEATKSAQSMMDSEVKAHHIRSKVCSTGVKATRQDIQNLRNRWKASIDGVDTSPEDAMFQELEDLLNDDPHGNVVLTYDEDSKEVQSIFFQTSYMKEGYETYPEVLIMDTTYKLCENGMPLTVYEVIDCFGAGRIAGYSIISSEKKEVVAQSLHLLVTGCPEASKRTGIVLIDKCPSNIAAVQDVLRHAEIHLCDFHVKDIFEKEGKAKMGADYKETVHPIVLKLIHAHTKNDYDTAYVELQLVANDEFLAYFNQYWHESSLVWSDFQRNQALNLGDRTTGRLESHNACIKKIIKQKLKVSGVIHRLRVMIDFKHMDDDYKLFLTAAKTKYHKYTKDPVIQLIMKLNTPFVGKLVLHQYERSLQPPSENPHNVTLSTCDCKFFTNTNLTCAHIFRLRKSEDVEIYNHENVPKRWKVTLPAGDLLGSAGPSNSILVVESASVKSRKTVMHMTSEQKYTECMNLCQDISAEMSKTGGNTYKLHVNALRSLKKLLKQGRSFAVVGLDENHDPEGIVFPASNADAQMEQQKDQPLQSQISSDKSSATTDPSGKIGGTSCATTEQSEKNCITYATIGEPRVQKLTADIKKSLKLPLVTKPKGRPKKNKARRRKYTVRKVSNKECETSDSESVDDDVYTVDSDEEEDKNESDLDDMHKNGSLNDSHSAPVSKNIMPHSDEERYSDLIEESESDDCVIFISEEPNTRTMTTLRSIKQEETKELNVSPCSSPTPGQTAGTGSENSVDDAGQCSMCVNFGKPTPETAHHKCAVCAAPVHAFGCSVKRTGDVDEGSGGNDLVCIPCSKKGDILPVSTPCRALFTSPEELEWKPCFQCGNKCEKKICQNGINAGRAYFACPACSKFICWAPLAKSPASKSPLPKSSTSTSTSKSCGGKAPQQVSIKSFVNPNSEKRKASDGIVTAPAKLPHLRCLSDKTIDQALGVLRTQFPDVEGWQEVASGTVSYDVLKTEVDSVNIVFDRTRNHWVTVIHSKLMDRNIIYIYDSLQRGRDIGNLTEWLQLKVAEMCHTEGPSITVVYPPCQQQGSTDKSSCGYFAIAHAVDFCFSRKLKCNQFNINKMPEHMTKCLAKGKFSSFPKDPHCFKSPSKVSVKEVIPVVCICRLPESVDRKVIECELCGEWFHFSCMKLCDSPAGSWSCPKHRL